MRYENSYGNWLSDGLKSEILSHSVRYGMYERVPILPYFFGYKTEFFPFQNNPKDLDPSYKMDLDLWGCLGRVKLVL